jgi:hypothetical protein
VRYALANLCANANAVVAKSAVSKEAVPHVKRFMISPSSKSLRKSVWLIFMITEADRWVNDPSDHALMITMPKKSVHRFGRMGVSFHERNVSIAVRDVWARFSAWHDRRQHPRSLKVNSWCGPPRLSATGRCLSLHLRNEGLAALLP